MKFQFLPENFSRSENAHPFETRKIRHFEVERKVLKSLKMLQDICDNVMGKVVFNSFRDSFITRCDEFGIPRHAIRGIVGHTEDNMTDLYSHDLTTARQVQQLPRVKLE